MSFKKKLLKIVLTSSCILMLVTTVFLIITTIIFKKKGEAIPFFKTDLYLVHTNSFDLIKPPSIAVAEKVESKSIGIGDIVIFLHPVELDDNTLKKTIGIIADSELITTPNESSDELGTLGGPGTGRILTIRDEYNKLIEISETAIVSKITKTSRFFGGIVSFALSPSGAIVIAVLPCILIVALEILSPFISKYKNKKKVDIINKQDETPTFVPNTNPPKKAREPIVKTGAVGVDPIAKGVESGVNVSISTKKSLALKAYKQASTLNGNTTKDDAAPPPSSGDKPPPPFAKNPPTKKPTEFTPFTEFTPNTVKAAKTNPRKNEMDKIDKNAPPSSMLLAQTIAALSKENKNKSKDVPIKEDKEGQ